MFVEFNHTGCIILSWLNTFLCQSLHIYIYICYSIRKGHKRLFLDYLTICCEHDCRCYGVTYKVCLTLFFCCCFFHNKRSYFLPIHTLTYRKLFSQQHFNIQCHSNFYCVVAFCVNLFCQSCKDHFLICLNSEALSATVDLLSALSLLCSMTTSVFPD